ncbi:MAG TPA: hypothetical protein EYP90_14130 [Chromatiaceae bacterium]|nr:hypothetical protein [Chromatiaceae bacterium]
MAELADHTPQLNISPEELRKWGKRWQDSVNEETGKSKRASAFDRQQSVNFASFIDEAFADALAVMLGNIPVEKPKGNALLPAQPDCVEVGPVRIIGGIRPQNFDAAYRPDGPRIVFDSKTLNDLKSVGKNWQNMVNDLATEAATVHTRFPYALVAFIIVIPRPALGRKQEAGIIRTLERLGSRNDVLDQAHLAEALSFVVWDPYNGSIDLEIPDPASNLRIEKFSNTLYPHYVNRYKGLPPHN